MRTSSAPWARPLAGGRPGAPRLPAPGEQQARGIPPAGDDRRQLRRLISVAGLENLETALAEGKGAVLYSGHIRSTPVFFAALARLGHPPAIVGFPPGDWFVPVDRNFLARRAEVLEQRFGCRYIYMRATTSVSPSRPRTCCARTASSSCSSTSPSARPPSTSSGWEDARPSAVARPSSPGRRARRCWTSTSTAIVPGCRSWRRSARPTGSQATSSRPCQECAWRLEAQVLRHPAQWSFFSSYEHSDVMDAADTRVPV